MLTPQVAWCTHKGPNHTHCLPYQLVTVMLTTVASSSQRRFTLITVRVIQFSIIQFLIIGLQLIICQGADTKSDVLPLPEGFSRLIRINHHEGTDPEDLELGSFVQALDAPVLVALLAEEYQLANRCACLSVDMTGCNIYSADSGRSPYGG